LTLIGGSTLAQHAIGIRAIALATAGPTVAPIATAADVLEGVPSANVRASQEWQAADNAAASVISSLRVEEYVGNFAAVRQGETGQPQLVDSRDLDRAITRFLDDPEARLLEASTSTVDPVLAQHAKRLLDALRACAHDTFEAANEAQGVVERLLEGHTPAQVARLAEQVGTTANDSGFFRPADKFREFRQAIDDLDQSIPPGSLELRADDLGTLVRGQWAVRETDRLAEALKTVKHVMVETKRESERSGTGAGDVSALETSVKAQLTELSTLARSFSSGGKK
jgi:hypothetical protein